MARRSRRKYTEPHRELDGDAIVRGGARAESGGDGTTWLVRPVSSPDKTYRCPGCNQEITPRTPHVVAWPDDHLFGADAGLEDRRHWHTPCWQARDRRRPH